MRSLSLTWLICAEAARRPRAIISIAMLGIGVGFVILPNPDSAYATLTLNGFPLKYSAGVMGFIAGGEFSAFGGLLGVLSMTVAVPTAAWRKVSGIAGVPAWRITAGVWLAALVGGLFLLTCMCAGTILRASPLVAVDGSIATGVWIFSSWAYGLGVAGAGISASIYAILSPRLASRPGWLIGAAFATWMVVTVLLLSTGADPYGMNFAGPLLVPAHHAHNLALGIVGHVRRGAAIAPLALSAIFMVPGGMLLVLERLAIVIAGLVLALLSSGARFRPVETGRGRRASRWFVWTSRTAARFGLAGVLFRQIWALPLLAIFALAVAFSVEVLQAGRPLGCIALGFAWGFYVLRWPEICAVFEYGNLRHLVAPSVLGPWPIRAMLVTQIILQMGLLALPEAIAFAANRRFDALIWLGVQVLFVPLLCIGIARLRSGAALFSLAGAAWWYMMVSGNFAPPPM
jgi:hypothetical protein